MRRENTKATKPPWLLCKAIAVFVLFTPLTGCSTSELESMPGITCETYCSTTESRVSLGNVHFGGLIVDPANARLEFTVYSEGFERGAFASFSPLTADPESEPTLSLPALRGLRPFRVQLVSVEPASDEQSILGVTLKGLEPNVNYAWRLRHQTEDGAMMSALAVCPTPVCIHDAQ